MLLCLPLAVQAASPEYSRTGADTCARCHDETSEFPVLEIFRTPHGRAADARTPFAGLQCEACHGPGGDHARNLRDGDVRPAIPYFGEQSPASAEDHNAVCLGCHQQAAGLLWPGSAHEESDTECSSCHQVHVRKDPVLQTATQTEVCVDCHLAMRADIQKPFTHPLRHGEMTCSSCHSPHGSTSEHLLQKADLNQTCFTCHADKRGPHLWEHAPSAEDCSLCHLPHGSNHPAMLTQRTPQLCQQCHSRAGHPSLAYTPAGLPDKGANAALLARGCVNCHSQVHGSNHPSGANLGR
ncbi:MAG: DmsE family decaheme c-type cytochrome [Gammaproteobacteria bacterium]|nr:DmsE family decaheme c-type cytochrome [Gammaproteobacteria bacterium]